MKSGPLKIGIACFPLIGGSGILATALGSELARRGHEVYLFSYAQPVRLDLPQEGMHFHRIDFADNALFPCPDYTLPLAVKMAEVARSQQLDLFHVHYAVPHALAACLASQIVGPSAPRIVTTLHGSDTTLARPGSQLPHRHRACPGAFRCGDGGFRKSSEPNPGKLSFETAD